MFDSFTPITGFGGGSIIGLSAATLLLFNGDIMGASGIFSTTALNPKKVLTDGTQIWKPVFISSFLVTSSWMFGTAATINSPEARVPVPSTLAFTLGGLLVGFGTKLSNGCTSGHGVCGLGRRSARSLAAVLTFMASAIATTYITSSEVAWSSMTQPLRTSSDNANASEPTVGFVFTTLFVVPTMLASARLALRKDTAGDGQQSKNSVAAISGSMFAAGLAISQMVLKTKLYGFLDVVVGIEKGDWDPTLATVLTGALLVSTVSYEFVKGHGMCNLSVAQGRPCGTLAPTRPKANAADASKDAPAAKFNVPSNKTIDGKLIAGAAMFGMGWGISLYCPGPALFLAATGDTSMAYFWVPAYIVGAYAAQKLKESSWLP